MTHPAAARPSHSVTREQSLRRSFSAIMIGGGPRVEGRDDGRPDSRRRRSSHRSSRRSSLHEIPERDPRDDSRPATRRATDPARGRATAGRAAEAPAAARLAPVGETGEGRQNFGRASSALKPTGEGRNAPPLPPPPFVEEHVHRGFRRDYRIGDVLRSPADVSHVTEAQAFRAASALEDYDFAFVKRSDGSFSYAILAYRSTELIRRGGGQALVECLNFVMSDEGATKKVAQGNWSKCVRLPAVEARREECLSPLTHEPPIRTVSCVPQTEDDCSMISNVSDSDSLRMWRRMHTA